MKCRPRTLELSRGTTGRVPSINYDLHMHAADSQDLGKPEQAKAKAMPFKRVKRIEFLKGHQRTVPFASLPH